MKCADCRYFSENLCYRYPPVKGKFALAKYPKVSKWCGEWASVEVSFLEALKEWIGFD